MYQLNAEKLNERMLELGITKEALVRKTYLSLSTIKAVTCRNARVVDSTAEKIARALGFSLEKFLEAGYAQIDTACDHEAKEKLITVFTENIRARKSQLELSRVALAECTGLSQREIFKLMNGQVNPKITTVACVAKALDVSIDDLITDGYDQTLGAK